MSTPVLFITTVFIWGTTWIAIAAQVGDVPVSVSVFYRFALDHELEKRQYEKASDKRTDFRLTIEY